MANVATDIGASEEIEDAVVDQAPVEQVVKNPREELYERMKAKRNAPAVDEDIETEVDEEDGEGEDPVIIESPIHEKDGKWYATRKVDGKEEEIAFDALLAESQKQAAADRRFEEAARIRRELEAKENELRRREQALLEQAQQKQTVDTRSLTRQYHQALLDGEDDEADRLLEQITAHKGPTFDPRVIAAEAKKEAVLEVRKSAWEKDEMQARKWLHEQNKDVVEDERTFAAARREFESILKAELAEGQQGNPRFNIFDTNPRQMYEEAVKRTKEWLGHSNAATDQARTERKRSATGRAAVGKTVRADISDKTPKPKTNRDKINDMRRRRGLSPLE